MNITNKILVSKIEFIHRCYLDELQAGGDSLRSWHSAHLKLCGFRLLMNSDQSKVDLIEQAIKKLDSIEADFKNSLNNVDNDISPIGFVSSKKPFLELLTEYMDYCGDYAACMPSEDWVDRVRLVVEQSKGITQLEELPFLNSHNKTCACVGLNSCPDCGSSLVGGY